MNADKQRIAIAEACGWRIKSCQIQGGYALYKPDGAIWTSFWDAPSDAIKEKLWDACSDELPDYLADLNAMHEAEKVLDVTNGGPSKGACLRYTYSHILYTIVPEWIQPFRATAAQRAEAFLRTIGKWGDGE